MKTVKTLKTATLALLAGLLVACGGSASVSDGGMADSMTPTDAAVLDSTVDGGVDAGERPDAASPDATLPRTDAGSDAEISDPPPGGPVLPPLECDGPRSENSATVTIEPLAEGACRHAATEGRILAIEADVAVDGVSFILHEGFDGGDAAHCRVTVAKVGTEVADEVAWAVGITYAAWMLEGTPGAFWIADGEGSWECSLPTDGFNAYPLVLWAGGDPDQLPPIYPGYDVQPDWEGRGCTRPSGECTDFEHNYQVGLFGRDCTPHRPEPTAAGETRDFDVDGSTRRFRVLRAWQHLACPVPGDPEITTAEFPPGSWLLWTAQ